MDGDETGQRRKAKLGTRTWPIRLSNLGARRNGVSEWATGQLEGPGMPVARGFPNPAPSVIPDVDTDGGAAGADGDGDGDDGKTYCFCERVSFGEMIACDDANCEREWVSAHFFLDTSLSYYHTRIVPFSMHWAHHRARRDVGLRGVSS